MMDLVVDAIESEIDRVVDTAFLVDFLPFQPNFVPFDSKPVHHQ